MYPFILWILFNSVSSTPAERSIRDPCHSTLINQTNPNNNTPSQNQRAQNVHNESTFNTSLLARGTRAAQLSLTFSNDSVVSPMVDRRIVRRGRRRINLPVSQSDEIPAEVRTMLANRDARAAQRNNKY